jgi:adenine-specific DNA-methyltransferase
MLPPVDLAYLDPPYNQHRYTANYHVWETLVAWDAPSHYGVACKRSDLRDPDTRSVFNARRGMPVALKGVIEALDARVLVMSCSDEGWVTMPELREWCEPLGHVEVLAFDSRRYVGAQIGVFNPQGERVGEPTRMRNVEYLVLCGDDALVQRACAAVAATSASDLVH